jgi:hypothetical protein
MHGNGIRRALFNRRFLNASHKRSQRDGYASLPAQVATIQRERHNVKRMLIKHGILQSIGTAISARRRWTLLITFFLGCIGVSAWALAGKEEYVRQSGPEVLKFDELIKLSQTEKLDGPLSVRTSVQSKQHLRH